MTQLSKPTAFPPFQANNQSRRELRRDGKERKKIGRYPHLDHLKKKTVQVFLVFRKD